MLARLQSILLGGHWSGTTDYSDNLAPLYLNLNLPGRVPPPAADDNDIFCAILLKFEICVNVQASFVMSAILGQRYPLRILYVELLFLMKMKGFR